MWVETHVLRVEKALSTRPLRAGSEATMVAKEISTMSQAKT